MSFASSSVLQLQKIATGNLRNRLNDALEVKHRVNSNFENVMSIVDRLKTRQNTFMTFVSNTVLHPHKSAYRKIQKAIEVMSQQFLKHDVERHFLKGIEKINNYVQMTDDLIWQSLEVHLSDVQVYLTPLILEATRLGTNDTYVQEQAASFSKMTLKRVMTLLGNLVPDIDMTGSEGSCSLKITALMSLVKGIDDRIMSSHWEVSIIKQMTQDYKANATDVKSCISSHFMAVQKMITWKDNLDSELYDITNGNLNNTDRKIATQMSKFNTTIHKIVKIFEDYRLNLLTKKQIREILVSKGIIKQATLELEILTNNVKLAISQPLETQVSMATTKLAALYQEVLMFTVYYMKYSSVFERDMINDDFKHAKIWQGHTTNIDDPSFPLPIETKYGLSAYGSVNLFVSKYAAYITDESENAIHNIMSEYMAPLSSMLYRFDAMAALHKEDLNQDLQAITTTLEKFSSEGEINKEFVM